MQVNEDPRKYLVAEPVSAGNRSLGFGGHQHMWRTLGGCHKVSKKDTLRSPGGVHMLAEDRRHIMKTRGV